MHFRPHTTVRLAQSGFTLIELLVVLSIMAAVAGIGVQSLGRVRADSQTALLHGEMDQIASAIQRFYADTGYWPKQGPFAADTVGFIDNPASLSQLRTRPNDGTNDILPFDVASGTGWNGPYIRELDAASVISGANLLANGTGSPTAGDQDDVRGIGDPYEAAPDGAYFEWTDTGGVRIARLGRPYLYFIDGASVTGCQAPCLLSFGPDGTYDQGGDDDIVINIAGN